MPSPDQLLQEGHLVQVSANSGEPGGGMMVGTRVNFNPGSKRDPLYVIDGVPIVAGNLAQNNFGQSHQCACRFEPCGHCVHGNLEGRIGYCHLWCTCCKRWVLITTKRGKSGDAKNL